MPAAPDGIEVHGPTIEVVSMPVERPPFDLFRPAIKAALPTILDHAAVALRHPRFERCTGLPAASATGYRQSLQARGFC